MGNASGAGATASLACVSASWGDPGEACSLSRSARYSRPRVKGADLTAYRTTGRDLPGFAGRCLPMMIWLIGIPIFENVMEPSMALSAENDEVVRVLILPPLI